MAYYFKVLQTSSGKSLILHVDTHSYLINTFEGFQRFCIESNCKLKFNTIILPTKYSIVPFIGTYLTMGDSGTSKLNILTPFVDCFNACKSFANRPKLYINFINDEKFTDDKITIKSILIEDALLIKLRINDVRGKFDRKKAEMDYLPVKYWSILCNGTDVTYNGCIYKAKEYLGESIKFKEVGIIVHEHGSNNFYDRSKEYYRDVSMIICFYKNVADNIGMHFKGEVFVLEDSVNVEYISLYKLLCGMNNIYDKYTMPKNINGCLKANKENNYNNKRCLSEGMDNILDNNKFIKKEVLNSNEDVDEIKRDIDNNEVETDVDGNKAKTNARKGVVIEQNSEEFVQENIKPILTKAKRKNNPKLLNFCNACKKVKENSLVLVKESINDLNEYETSNQLINSNNKLDRSFDKLDGSHSKLDGSHSKLIYSLDKLDRSPNQYINSHNQFINSNNKLDGCNICIECCKITNNAEFNNKICLIPEKQDFDQKDVTCEEESLHLQESHKYDTLTKIGNKNEHALVQKLKRNNLNNKFISQPKAVHTGDIIRFNLVTSKLEIERNIGEILYTTENKSPGSIVNTSVIFLGTGCAIPSKYRNVTSILIKHKEKYIFLDCGEDAYFNTLRFFGHSKIIPKVDCIFISHSHADHCLGIIKLAHEITKHHDRLKIICPKVIKDFVEMLVPGKITYFLTDELSHNFNTYMKWEDTVLSFDFGYRVQIVPVSHCTDSCAIRIDFDDFTLSYSGDCRPSTLFMKLSNKVDLMIHEATFDDSLKEKALKTKHTTSGEAVQIFKESRAKRLILTHFSQRYPKCVVVPGVIVAFDFFVYDVNDFNEVLYFKAQKYLRENTK